MKVEISLNPSEVVELDKYIVDDTDYRVVPNNVKPGEFVPIMEG